MAGTNTATGGRAYGSTTISGTATAILGDNHRYGDSIQIRNATFVLDDISTLVPRIAQLLESANNSEMRRDQWHSERVIGMRRYQDSCEEQSNCLSNRKESLFRKAGGTLQNCVQAATVRIKNGSDPDVRDGQHLAERTRPLLLPESELLCPCPKRYHRRGDFGDQDSAGLESDTSSPKQQVANHQITEPYAVAALLCAFIAYRTIPPIMVVKALSAICQDSTFPLLTATFAFWISSVMRRADLRKQPSEYTGDCTVFVDAYGCARKVPMAYLADPCILEGFFKSHYQGSSAEHLVSGKRYVLTLYTRYGPVKSISQICQSHSSKSESSRKFIMAVVYRASLYRCIDCTNELEVSLADSRHWYAKFGSF